MKTIPLLSCVALICAMGCKAKVEFESRPITGQCVTNQWGQHTDTWRVSTSEINCYNQDGQIININVCKTCGGHTGTLIHWTTNMSEVVECVRSKTK